MDNTEDLEVLLNKTMGELEHHFHKTHDNETYLLANTISAYACKKKLANKNYLMDVVLQMAKAEYTVHGTKAYLLEKNSEGK